MSNKVLSLIKKIDGYVEDKIDAGDILPYGKTGMKILAIKDYILYGTSFSEYFAYQFYRLNAREKRTFMTRRHMFRFFDKYNPKEYRERIGDKRKTKELYGRLLNRAQFDYSEGKDAFFEFAEFHPQLFIKKAVSWGGDGAFAVDASNPDSRDKIWQSISKDCVIEERLQNCEEINRLYPGSLNTIKVVTLWLGDHAEIQTALFRLGNNTCVDNVHSGGMCALVDINTGIVMTKAYDNHFREFIYHPVSGNKILGFQIPEWSKVKLLALEAAAITPEMKYTSWDIAVTNNGPKMIEGNWDAEFYAEQMIMEKGVRKDYCRKIERAN